MKKFGLLAIIAGVAGVMIAIFVLGNRAEAPNPANEKRVGQQIADQGQDHIKEGESHEPYNSNPATSGPHYAIAGVAPTAWGIKDSELADEILVHNLEHGGVVITYKPDLPSAQIEQLKQIVKTLPQSQNFNSVKVVLVPRAKNDRPISLTAWTYLEHLDTPDGAKIKEFYLSHLDKGPELVP
jgi:hypothetical protein